MRRKDRECDDPVFYEDVLSRASEIYLALLDHDFPWCFPVNFAYMDRKIYFHSAHEGRKMELLERNRNLAFSAAVDIEVAREKSTTYYKSVCGVGTGQIVGSAEEKCMALEVIAKKYKAACPIPFPRSQCKRVAIVRIDIISLSGKRSMPATARKDD